ncbi:sulfur oxidation c-type cytochrome SoxA [Cognatiyoonia sp. IB215182]|uniref:sulfur oxidation c-type cytochrome SoxA n=1 Tax=Cognatiyoonia sp. IB215182 TaxID=3097353 RepID=UPI002A1831D5|nr:sulfur oxidation c-type cytochrome SoxA [Cognatiyoonia sp. IB215182]MDX8350847.1 sulfur oxidation c-type cytochrome SoxA [Cognatiyoonia sp. IB215182]
MKTKLAVSVIGVCLALPLGLAVADPNADLVINGEIPITVRTAAPDHVENLRTIYSGWTYRSSETQSLQMDDFENPGMIFVDEAIDAWNTVEGSAGESCASCHGAPEELAGVRAVYPRWNEEAGEVRTMAMQVNDCRTRRMGAEEWAYDKNDMLNMEALLASVSRGYPVNVAIDGPAQSMWELGRELYYTRTGQLELSCANCHEDNYDNNIRADHLSQGMINGFPTYRLKNAKLNGVHSRFRGCVRDTRAETYRVGTEEFIALELYVMSRGNGLSVEGPSVRN